MVCATLFRTHGRPLPAGNVMASGGGAKRARGADILSSLDAAFAAAGQAAASKYTSQAAVRAEQAAQQQAFAHKRKKKSGGKRGGGNGVNGGKQGQDRAAEQQTAVDPMYRRLGADVLSVGLRGCSLQAKIPNLTSTSSLNGVLNRYLSIVSSRGTSESATPSTAVVEKLRNKVMQLDNPVRTTDAAKRSGNDAFAQTAKLMNARQRRQAGLHLLTGEMPIRDAELLSGVWQRYARDQLENDFVEHTSDAKAREITARVHAKLSTMDLSGCPVELVQSRNPCNIGLRGIIVAETRKVIQVCCSPAGKIRTLPKADITLCIRPYGNDSDQCRIIVDGAWLSSRQHKLTDS